MALAYFTRDGRENIEAYLWSKPYGQNEPRLLLFTNISVVTKFLLIQVLLVRAQGGDHTGEVTL